MHHLLDPGVLRLTRTALDAVDHVAAAGRVARGADAVLAPYKPEGEGKTISTYSCEAKARAREGLGSLTTEIMPVRVIQNGIKLGLGSQGSSRHRLVLLLKGRRIVNFGSWF